MSSIYNILLKEHNSIKEKGSLKEIGVESYIIFKDKNGFPHWYLKFIGPKNSPYEGGFFYIEIKFPKDYPNSAPEVQMRTPTYHPNISTFNGNICMDYIANWKNSCDVRELIFAIFVILAHPSLANSYNKLDEEKAKEFTKKYASKEQIINSWNMGWNE